MLSAVPMRRLSVVLLEREERAVLRGLGRIGVVHITRAPAGPETAPIEPRDRSAERAQCDRLCERITELRKSLDMAAPVGPPGPPSSLAPAETGRILDDLSRRAAELLSRRDELQQGWGRVTALVEQVKLFKGMDIPFDQLGRSAFLHFAVGSLPEDRMTELHRKVGENVVFLPVMQAQGRRWVVAATSRAGRLALETALRAADFRPETLPATEGTTADVLAGEGHREQERLAEALKEASRAVSEMAAETAPSLAALEQSVLIERRLLEVEENFPRTDATVLITGWVPAADFPRVASELKEITGGRCVIESEPPAGTPEEQVPVLLRHSRLLRPFELLVSGYGLPGYGELEPTLFVAITYVLMFGMMFGDVGHGAVLVTGGLAAWFASRAQKIRDVGVLIALAGLSSMVFGVLYGSYFGLKQCRAWAVWRDPLEGDPATLMKTAIAIGVVIISLGLFLNIINRFRKRDWVGGFLDRFGVAGVLFYWGVLALVLKYAAFQRRGLVGMIVALVVVLPIVAWVLKEPVRQALARRRSTPPVSGHGESSVIENVIEPAVEAFETVLGYMANTISFVRLAAYAMSHAAILMATFIVAAELGKNPAGGGAWSVLVIIVGNVIAIVLEGIIASVQALRLEYYEFFGKFFSGNGRAFAPFRLSEGMEKERTEK